MSNQAWEKIFADYKIASHDFARAPFELSAQMIKEACQPFKKTGEKEPRILCKQDTREKRPQIMADNGLFLLPVKNGQYLILRGEGYVDIPDISSKAQHYPSKLDFDLETSKIGNSEMQHLDFAYASSLIRNFVHDKSLVLTIRGRKYTPKFSFRVGKHIIHAQSVQTEVDAGYEGKDKVVLVEAKNSKTNNIIIRQLFYPFKQWRKDTQKEIFLLFFEKRGAEYMIWHFQFDDERNYNSIRLIKSQRYVMGGH